MVFASLDDFVNLKDLHIQHDDKKPCHRDAAEACTYRRTLGVIGLIPRFLHSLNASRQNIKYIKNGNKCKYTISFHKIWGQNNKINPVLYIQEESYVHNILTNLLNKQKFHSENGNTYLEVQGTLSIYDLNTIENYDSAIIEYLNLPIGSELIRIEGTKLFEKTK